MEFGSGFSYLFAYAEGPQVAHRLFLPRGNKELFLNDHYIHISISLDTCLKLCHVSYISQIIDGKEKCQQFKERPTEEFA